MRAAHNTIQGAEAPRELFNIGEVVSIIREEFSEISISKIRYFEKEHLIAPKRTSGGYRKFDREDINKLTFILRLQKEQYLPLSVIREKLCEYDSQPAFRLSTGEEHRSGDDTVTELTPDEVVESFGISIKELNELSDYGLVKLDKRNGSGTFKSDSLEIIRVMTELKAFGIEPRHIKFYKNFAIKQSTLLDQIFAPMKLKYADARKRDEIFQRLLGMSLSLNESLLKETIQNDS